MGLQGFEGRLERMVDGTLSKAFRGDLHPVEIGRRLTREMDLERRVGVQGLMSPNAFVVHLSPTDFDRFESFLDALVRELEEAAREHARTEGYVFVSDRAGVFAPARMPHHLLPEAPDAESKAAMETYAKANPAAPAEGETEKA